MVGINPVEGEVWQHPETKNLYAIHSVTDDGWVRYIPSKLGYSIPKGYPLYTQPKLTFISMYEKVHGMGWVPSVHFEG